MSAGLDVRREKIGHGHDGRVPQRLLFLLQLIDELRLLLLLLPLLIDGVRRLLMLVRQGTLIVVQIVATIVEEVHEECGVFQEQLRLRFHQISSITLLGLQRKRMEKGVHRRLIQFPCQMLILIDHQLRGVDVHFAAHADPGWRLSERVNLIELMRVADDPVGLILDELVAEFDLLAKGEIVASFDHRLHQLTDANANGHRPDTAVQISRVPNDVQDQLLQADDVRQRFLVDLLRSTSSTPAARTGSRIVRRATDEAVGLFGTNHLSVGIEELVHLDLDLIEENRITERIQFMSE